MPPAKRKKIVVIGGGTGTYTVLSGLKKYPVDLTAIVSMADDGGSTGRLRDEYGVLPPGDIRQCLVALSEASDTLRQLFNYRFETGDLEGHSFGNLFITALEKSTGDFNKAMEVASEVLKVKGEVFPVTLEKIHLHIELKNGKTLHGEHLIDTYQMISRFGVKRIALDRPARANPKALAAIKEADLIVIGPGDFYGSIIPHFLIDGIVPALARAKGKKVYVLNLMNKYGHTDNFTVHDFVSNLEKFLGSHFFDIVVYNTEHPSPALIRRYVDEGEPVRKGTVPRGATYRVVDAKLLNHGRAVTSRGDVLARSLIRHDSGRLAKVLWGLL